MNLANSKITIHMVSSLDGFIAKNDGDVGWIQSTDSYEKGISLTTEYVQQFLESIDCYVMGSKTYEHAIQLGWPYGNVPVFVFTTRNLTTEKENVEFISGDLTELVNNRIRKNYTNIWMVGGSFLTKEFLRCHLADEINVTIAPILLGNGAPFFSHIGDEQSLHLKDVTAFNDGMVELVYEIRKR